MSRYRVGTSKLAGEAGFGVRVWSPVGYVVAKYYRRIIAFFVISILYFALAPYTPPIVAAVAFGAYVLYFLLRHFLSSRAERRFYHEGPQLVRAHLSILCIVGLQALLQWYGARTSVWILYLLPLAMISRHCKTGVYALVMAEVCALMIGVRFIAGSPVWVDQGRVLYDPDLAIQCLGLSLAAFILHYLMRNIDARNDTIESLDSIETLSDPVPSQEAATGRWHKVLGTYLKILKGMCGSVWLCDHNTRRLKLLPESVVCSTEKGCTEHPSAQQAIEIDMDSDDPIAQAARTSTPLFCDGAVCPLAAALDPMSIEAGHDNANLSAHSRIIVPITEQDSRTPRSLGVVCIDFDRHTTPRAPLLEDYFVFLSGLARRLQGVLHNRRKAEELQALQHIGWRAYSRPTLADTLEDVLDAVMDTLGFEFALISLVDEDVQRIKAFSGRNLPSGQIQDCVHSLDDKDITADVVRTGAQEVLSGWDPRFDERIWNAYGHVEMVRVFTPIGGDGNSGGRASGVIEAGYYTHTREKIENEQLAMLKAFAGQVFNAIENARLYERTRRRAEILTSLQHISNKVSYDRNVDTVLNDVVKSIKVPLDADIVMLYPRSQQTGGLLSPYVAGDLYGLERHPLSLPPNDRGVIAAIVHSREPYYQPDAQDDPLLIDMGEEPGDEALHQADLGEGDDSFTQRQGIVSFAGVPMVARDEVVGVLCVNYRARHAFRDDEKQVLEIAAQMAAAASCAARSAVLSREVAASRERARLANQLHHSLSQYLPAIVNMSETAEARLERDPDQVPQQLHKIRHAAEQAMCEVRVNLLELCTSSLADHTLEEILSEQAREAGYYFGLTVDSDLRLYEEVSPSLAQEIIMIQREALANTAKHACANSVWISVHSGSGGVHMSIVDDGCGFDTTTIGKRGKRGLVMLRERIEQLSGTFSVASTPDEGTKVAVALPIH